ncbi:MAG TPA: four helix bundle protein [Chitinophagaceae bacterium]|nr:four helix bundle protein [Chitinophagaceae bacterium]HCY90077.1 four helix bundle protein [Chitinophagaceae bacterium]HRF26990.1 four helix bundle protein [Ferruginibacter sp.]
MTRQELQQRTKKFNIDVIIFCNFLPKTVAGFELGKQLIRSASSVGANYRASSRAKSTADFINKIQIVIEEADECAYWFEVILESHINRDAELIRLKREAYELTAIFTATNKTIKSRFKRRENITT